MSPSSLKVVPNGLTRVMPDYENLRTSSSVTVKCESLGSAWRASFASTRACAFTAHAQTPGESIARPDLFALTSASEGFPNVLLEAVMPGVPAIATVVGGAVDVLAGRRHLLAPLDTDAASRLFRAVLDDHGRTRAQAGALRQRAEIEWRDPASRCARPC